MTELGDHSQGFLEAIEKSWATALPLGCVGYVRALLLSFEVFFIALYSNFRRAVGVNNFIQT